MSGAAVERPVVKVTCEGLATLLDHARRAQTVDQWIPLALEWSAKANDEIVRLTAELQQCRPQWRSIDSLPITVTPDDSWAAIHCLMYGPRIGIVMARVWKGTSECVGAAAAHLGGDVIRYWGATHWMPMPAEPEAALKERT